jgi:copper transport protein
LILKLVQPDGSAIALDRHESNGATLVIDAPALEPGTHVLVWRIVSEDGHPVGGSLVFSFGAPSAGGQPSVDAPADRAVQTALWLAKVGLYVGLFFGVGGAFFLSWIGRAARPATQTVLAALAIGLIAATASIGLQGLDALELPLAALFNPAVWQAGYGTTYGNTVIVATTALLAALASVSLDRRALARPLSLAALVGVGLALAASGHAADATPRWLTRPAVFLHGVGIACWLGALVPLACLLAADGPGRAAALGRFSRLIPFPVGALAVAGCVLGVIQVETPSALVSTAYGLVLLAKLAILAALFALAAYNRWRLTGPAAGAETAAAAPLARMIRVEIVLAAAILAVVGLWRFTPPPRVIAIEAAIPATVHIHGEKAMADVVVAPGHAGPVAVSIFVMTGAFDPLPAKAVTLLLSNPAAGIEPIRRPATLVEGSWHVEDLVVPLAGRWTAKLDILVSDFEMVKLEGEITIRK